jgi:serine/threonine-protein kinase
MIGRKLAHYEITSRLGAGGMGEVFQAEDTKLGRSVAIKVLPDEFTQNADRLDRFEREARALAALNHPHIAAIYGIEEYERRRFLVLELVEGETLAERLKRGPIPAAETVPLALQIAEALEAAHEKGIVHRDLKPANIKINPEGNVKVLDFGLAKAFDADPAAVDRSNSPTLSMQATAQGIILGTAAYMAPEQARGLPVDRRADVWAFGCVLYEMLTGRQAFGGEMVTDILASVLVREPDYSALEANIYPGLKELLLRCLEKNPKKRWQAIGDVRYELEHIATHPVAAIDSARPAQFARRPLWLTVAAIAGVMAIAFVAGIATRMLDTSEPPPVTRFYQLLPEGQQFSNLNRSQMAVSPDGSHIAYMANSQVYIRATNEFEARPVPGTEDINPANPFFSPDGQWIAYWTSSGQLLKKISIRGGAAVILCRISNIFGASWSADGTILFGQPTGIMRVSENGGNPELIIATKPGEQSDGPQLLPDGETVLFSLTSSVGANRWDQAQVVAQSLRTGERKILTGGSDAQYIPTGHLLYALRDTLFVAPFDVDGLKLTGGPVPIASGVQRATNPAINTATANYGVSDTGLLAYVVGLESGNANSVVWVDRKGRAEPLPNLPRRKPLSQPALSPDNRRLAVVESGDIWIYELDRGGSIRLTQDGGNARPTWDPIGLQIGYSSLGSGTEHILVRRSDGSGEARQLTKTGLQNHLDSWSPDGTTMSFHRHDSSVDMFTMSLGVNPAEQVFLRQPLTEEAGVISPDGKWIAYASNETGRVEIYITSYPSAGSKFPVSTNGGTQPVWARNGELFYTSLDYSRMMVVKLSTKPSLEITRPELLFEGQYQSSGVGYKAGYDVNADATRFVMIQPDVQRSSGSSRPQINIVQNWFRELRERVPVK